MSNIVKCNSLVLDARILVRRLKPYFNSAIEKFCDRLIEIMQFEIDKSSQSPTSWREEAKNNLKKEVVKITDDFIVYKVGLMYSPPDFQALRAMVVTYGVQRRVVVGPYGRTVFTGRSSFDRNGAKKGEGGRKTTTNDFNGTKPSRYPLESEDVPELKTEGHDWLSGAFTNAKTHFEDALDNAFDRIPNDVFFEALTVKMR